MYISDVQYYALKEKEEQRDYLIKRVNQMCENCNKECNKSSEKQYKCYFNIVE